MEAEAFYSERACYSSPKEQFLHNISDFTKTLHFTLFFLDEPPYNLELLLLFIYLFLTP